jgi:hypothetical protein
LHRSSSRLQAARVIADLLSAATPLACVNLPLDSNVYWATEQPAHDVVGHVGALCKQAAGTGPLGIQPDGLDLFFYLLNVFKSLQVQKIV